MQSSRLSRSTAPSPSSAEKRQTRLKTPRSWQYKTYWTKSQLVSLVVLGHDTLLKLTLLDLQLHPPSSLTAPVFKRDTPPTKAELRIIGNDQSHIQRLNDILDTCLYRRTDIGILSINLEILEVDLSINLEVGIACTPVANLLDFNHTNSLIYSLVERVHMVNADALHLKNRRRVLDHRDRYDFG